MIFFIFIFVFLFFSFVWDIRCKLQVLYSSLKLECLFIAQSEPPSQKVYLLLPGAFLKPKFLEQKK